MTAPARLDERLVQTTLDLLADEGLPGLSLRQIARSTGVSHGAPLRHFRGLADLLSEAAARGFAGLSEAIQQAIDELPRRSTPLDGLAACARAYVETAVAHPALFSLMFQPDRLDWSNPRLIEASHRAFEHLLEQVRAAQATGWRSGTEPRLLAGSLWSALHGLATLWSQGALSGPVPDASLDEALATTLELVLSDPQGGPS